MDKIVLKIKGLDCANCARELEEELNNLQGLNASVDFMNMKVTLESESIELIDKAKYIISHFEEVEIVKDLEKITIKIEGLDCANCARELEEELNKLDNIEASVDFMNMKVVLYSDSEMAINKAKYVIKHFAEVQLGDEDNESNESPQKDYIALAISGVLFIAAILISNFVSVFAGKVVSYILYILAYVVVGHEVLINTVKNLSIHSSTSSHISLLNCSPSSGLTIHVFIVTKRYNHISCAIALTGSGSFGSNGLSYLSSFNTFIFYSPSIVMGYITTGLLVEFI